ncbi:MAG: cytochrome P460 family protein [Proteobacteria bacterium]|nr:hypothetical protein [Pseudomonadota bacterium]NOG59923.1 cytochrome P460 family protein [Pseudomonadota bacterium]
MRNSIVLLFLISVSVFVYAGGTPDFVTFPEDYKSSYILYHTQNRANNKQVADFYANKQAVESIKNGELADGSVVVMEVYKPELDEAGKPVAGVDGLFKKSKLAAIAVMEKRSNWGDQFSAEDRTGNWGYAIYDAKGSIKENNLDCVSCHKPLEKEEFLFTFEYLGK